MVSALICSQVHIAAYVGLAITTYIYGVYTAFYAKKSPYIWSYTVRCINTVLAHPKHMQLAMQRFTRATSCTLGTPTKIRTAIHRIHISYAHKHT
jgi:hypothetical protein